MTYDALYKLFHGQSAGEDDLPYSDDPPPEQGRSRGRGRSRTRSRGETETVYQTKEDTDKNKIECLACSGSGQATNGPAVFEGTDSCVAVQLRGGSIAWKPIRGTRSLTVGARYGSVIGSRENQFWATRSLTVGAR